MQIVVLQTGPSAEPEGGAERHRELSAVHTYLKVTNKMNGKCVDETPHQTWKALLPGDTIE